MQLLSTGTWASIDERCPLRCKIEGGDTATVIIGGECQSVELTFNVAGLRRLAEVSGQVVAEMVELAQREDDECEAMLAAAGARS